MPKILAFVHAYQGHGRNAGAESTLHDMLKFLVRQGWEADVLISKAEESIPEGYTLDGVTVIPFGHKSDFNRMIKGYDVVITHLECSTRATLVCRTAGVPAVQLIHNTMWQTEGYLAKGCDLAIYNTDWVKDHHESKKRQGVLRQLTDDGKAVAFRRREYSDWDSIVLHPVVDPADYRVDTTREYVTMVNLYANKGPHIFYALAERNPHLKFLGVKGGYGAQVLRHDLPNVTIIPNTHGIRDDVYAKSRLILMPSDYESYGRIAVEAMASGIPTIASPTEGLVEALDYAGNFADVTSEWRWNDKLQTLTTNPDAYHEASDAALKRSDELWKRSVDELAVFEERMLQLAKR